MSIFVWATCFVIPMCAMWFAIGYAMGKRKRIVRKEVTGYVVYKVEREKDEADWWKGDDE